MALFIDTWYPHEDPKPLGEYLKKKVEDAPDYHDGQLEALGAKVRVLTSLVVQLAESLPKPAQLRLAEQLGLKEYEPPPEFPLPVGTK